MKLEILQYPDPRLKERSAPVAEITPEIRQLAADMAETMYESEGIGLAAPQVGRFIRMLVMDLSGPSERANLQTYINPELEILGDERADSEEGCLSVPDLRSKVERGAKVRLKALNLEGEPVTLEAEELRAICLQHECDHLDGVLFVDRISRLKKNMYDKKLRRRDQE